MGETKYRPDIAIHPGKTLVETIGALNMSQIEFAERTGLTPKTINEIAQGKNPITPESAIKFAAVVGTSPSFWNNLQRNYETTVVRLKSEEIIGKEVFLLARFECYRELVKCEYVEKTRVLKEKVINLLNFFGVSSLTLVTKVQAIAFRKTKNKNLSKESLAAWLRCGEIEANKSETQPFDKETLKNSINELRALTKESPEVFSVKLKEVCARAGIAVVFVPHFKKTFVNGATKWINPKKALIQLSIKGKRDDIFWFTFFHELGHLVKHGKREQFVDLESRIGGDKEENEADIFASDTLIPKTCYNRFFENGDFSRRSIRTFAKEMNINPSIVAGRLSRETGQWDRWSNLRTKIQFKDK